MTRARLGLPPDADAAEIRHRYRFLASQRHPDAGGTVAAMVELQGWLEAALAEPRALSLPQNPGKPPSTVGPVGEIAPTRKPATSWRPEWHTAAFVVAGMLIWDKGVVETAIVWIELEVQLTAARWLLTRVRKIVTGKPLRSLGGTPHDGCRNNTTARGERARWTALRKGS